MPRVKWNSAAVLANTNRQMSAVLRALAARGIADIGESMRTTPEGATAGPKRMRSVPGKPPAPQFGLLLRSLAVDDSEALTRLRVRVGPRAGQASIYGLYLEIGAPPHLLPRPFLRPWLPRAREIFRTMIAPAGGGAP